MKPLTLAHLSDLHLGASPAHDEAAAALVGALAARAVDHVVVTGDVTNRGRRPELARFRQLFAPLADRVTVVPGNHDRWGDDVSGELFPGGPVRIVERRGLYLVCVDSSGPHNRAVWVSYGRLDERAMADIEKALGRAPAGALVALLLHHHLLPQPEESLPERLAALVGWPHVGELDAGTELLARLRGRCDLVLHGHRHVPRSACLHANEKRPLEIYNAGSSTALGRARLFRHAGGFVLDRPRWVDVRARQKKAA
jgi:3',5'-cyclic AMP phosphodiesterase CpdA